MIPVAGQMVVARNRPGVVRDVVAYGGNGSGAGVFDLPLTKWARPSFRRGLRSCRMKEENPRGFKIWGPQRLRPPNFRAGQVETGDCLPTGRLQAYAFAMTDGVGNRKPHGFSD